MEKTKQMVWLFGLTILLVACNANEQDSSANEATGEQKEEMAEDVDDDSKVKGKEESAKTEASEEASSSKQNAPEDQGAMEGWFEGEIAIVGKTVTASGTTNLLPGSELTLVTDPEEGTVIGSKSSTSVVEDDGTFLIERDVPDNMEGLVNLELKFEVVDQEEEVNAHYEDKLGGDFVRVSTDINNDTLSKKLSFKETISIDDGNQAIDIVEPNWEANDELGNTNVQIDANVSRKGNYLVVKLNSNLVDGTYVSGKPIIPGYVATGFMAFTYTNPDGSALLYIKNPEKDDRIKDLEEFEILIEMDPSRHENSLHVHEAYGENGEKLKGELVKDLDDSNVIEKKITVIAEN
ncbi:hypothetical protein [Oceanobacillus manasiensis]|uniref:hypothetical protein n=1 Tax=Oceanobacillus manasiensis TaxID=586413 RepID=UPI0005A95AA3|nr:hypothetical protein [Oceanobacillus manasiensis]